eukprot:695937-Rhodomonas_salina.1
MSPAPSINPSSSFLILPRAALGHIPPWQPLLPWITVALRDDNLVALFPIDPSDTIPPPGP